MERLERKERFQLLLQRHLANLATAEEVEELSSLIQTGNYDAVLKDTIDSVFAEGKAEHTMDADRAHTLLYQVFLADKPKAKVVRLNWRRLAVGVAAVVFVLLAGYWWINRQSPVVNNEKEIAATNDVKAPDKSRATIMLADGRIVYLDSAGNGRLAAQNGVEVIKNSDGAIVYQQERQNESSKEMAYNTLYNPRGSKVMNLTLADDTRVWLNSESSLKYPTAFTGNSREVEITGEAYFEVAHNAQKPFYVTKGAMAVKVLGTHFNVNAYEDEEAIRVTLLEGSVEVKSQSRTSGTKVKIKPGEQAVLSQKSNQSTPIQVQTPDLDAVMAWKNGRFVFEEKVDIQTIMRQVARWYDVEVEYKGTINKHFGGSISREVSISELLKVMQATGGVNFKVEGKKVLVFQP